MRTGPGREAHRQGDVLADESPEQLLDVPDHLVEVDLARLQHLLPAEGQQLTGQARGALRGQEDLVQLLVPALCVAGPPRHLRIAGDHRQQVVEVVRHPAGQPPDGLHLLRLPQLLLELQPFPHVGGLAVTPQPESRPQRREEDAADGPDVLPGSPNGGRHGLVVVHLREQDPGRVGYRVRHDQDASAAPIHVLPERQARGRDQFCQRPGNGRTLANLGRLHALVGLDGGDAFAPGDEEQDFTGAGRDDFPRQVRRKEDRRVFLEHNRAKRRFAGGGRNPRREEDGGPDRLGGQGNEIGRPAALCIDATAGRLPASLEVSHASRQRLGRRDALARLDHHGAVPIEDVSGAEWLEADECLQQLPHVWRGGLVRRDRRRQQRPERRIVGDEVGVAQPRIGPGSNARHPPLHRGLEAGAPRLHRLGSRGRQVAADQHDSGHNDGGGRDPHSEEDETPASPG